MDEDDVYFTDDDRQTPSTEYDSSTDILSEVTEKISIVAAENDQRRPSTSSTYVQPMEVTNRHSIPNINIEHAYESTDDSDPFNDEKRIITDEHVNVSRVNRASYYGSNPDTLSPKSDICLRRKSTGNVYVFRSNKRLSQPTTTNIQTDHETSQRTCRQNPERANQAPTADRKIIATKPVVTRISVTNELPLKMCEKEMHVTVKYVNTKQKKSS